MAWIESHTEIERHRKVLLMADELEMEPVHLSGHLHALWHAVLEQQEDGNLSTWPDSMVARQAQFNGDCSKFVSLLKKHKFLEENGLIHDWLDYAGRYLKNKYHTANPRKLKAIEKLHKSTSSQPKGRSKSDNQPNQPTTPNQPHTKGESPTENGFEEFWSGYPRKEKKPAALKVWIRLHPSDELRARILDDVACRRKTEEWKRETGRYIPQPSTYLNQRRWEDEGTVTAQPSDPWGKYAKAGH